jgi:hypothetical protein
MFKQLLKWPSCHSKPRRATPITERATAEPREEQVDMPSDNVRGPSDRKSSTRSNCKVLQLTSWQAHVGSPSTLFPRRVSSKGAIFVTRLRSHCTTIISTYTVAKILEKVAPFRKSPVAPCSSHYLPFGTEHADQHQSSESSSNWNI